MKESPKPQLKFFYYKEASTFSWEKRKENGSLKLFPNLYIYIYINKKEWKKMFIKISFTVKYILVPKRTTNKQDNYKVTTHTHTHTHTKASCEDYA